MRIPVPGGGTEGGRGCRLWDGPREDPARKRPVHQLMGGKKHETE